MNHNRSWQDFDPYQTPQSTAEDGADDGTCVREGKKVFVPAGGNLPCLCVRCGSAAAQRKPHTYYWHHPALYLTLLLAILIGAVAVLLYAVLALAIRKKTVLSPALCARHRRRVRLANWTAGGMVLALTALIYVGVSTADSAVETASAVGSLVCIGVLMYVGVYNSAVRTYAVRIGPDGTVLKGFGKGFLEKLPQR